MNRRSLIARRLRHPLCRSPRWGSKTHVQILRRKKAEHLIYCRRLTRPGTACHNEKTVLCGAKDCPSLFLLQCDPALFEQFFHPGSDSFIVIGDTDIKAMQHPGSIQLKIIVSCKIDDFSFVRFCENLCRFIREEIIPEKVILVIIFAGGSRPIRVFLMIRMVANNNFSLQGK